MEGDDGKASTWLETAFGGSERVDKLAELVVDVDPQRLERPRRRMVVVATGTANLTLDEFGELVRRGDRIGLAARQIARAIAVTGASAKLVRISASISSGASAMTSAALGPARDMRISSGPSAMNEKPRSASSSCIEETPMSRYAVDGRGTGLPSEPVGIPERTIDEGQARRVF